ncbi:MAG: nickel-dependent hydrogenase large subunit [Polyangiaceae bacterium]
MKTRTLNVGYMTRVEGEAALVVKTRGDEVLSAELRIFEPPRLFEAMLRGRSCLEAPDITARICGICPVAYQMSACAAVEDALGIAISPEVRLLRRLLYCGEWIESHVLHMVMLHAPDFFDLPDAAALARLHPERVRAALRIKKAGNAILAALGGREIHPVNVRVGGFYRAPRREELEPLVPELTWARAELGEMLSWMSAFPYPEVEHDYLFVALRHPAEYPLAEGRVVSSRGLDIPLKTTTLTSRRPTSSEPAPSTQPTTDRRCSAGPLAVRPEFRQAAPAGYAGGRGPGWSGRHVRNPFKACLSAGLGAVCRGRRRSDASTSTILRRARRRLWRCVQRPGSAVRRLPEASCIIGIRSTKGLITALDAGVPPTSQNQRE